jgi:hypothetical protein
LKNTNPEDEEELLELRKLTNLIFENQNTLKNSFIVPIAENRKRNNSENKIFDCIEACDSEEDETVN